MAVMREGRIVAQGSPDEVLGLPADEWIASFVGMEPPLAGTVAGCAGGLSSIDVDGATIVTAQQLPVGRRVIAAVRPEDVALYAGDADLPPGSARNHFRTEIVRLRPQGGTMLVTLRVGTSTIAATVSRVSASELSLTEGGVVTAVFKATAVRAREVD
jgi:molybdopterin-binding protein